LYLITEQQFKHQAIFSHRETFVNFPDSQKLKPEMYSDSNLYAGYVKILLRSLFNADVEQLILPSPALHYWLLNKRERRGRSSM
jgi:hypothetical protein